MNEITNNEESVVITDINFNNVSDRLLNEISILDLYLGGIYGNSKIEVYTKEGNNIPHFHIVNNGLQICCPCIYEPYYFNHGTKNKTLNNTQLKILNDKLKEKVPNNKLTTLFTDKEINDQNNNKTYWDAIRSFYTRANNDTAVRPTKQPDYTKMVNLRN